MAERLASHYSNCAKAEYIIPVPLHRKRLTERGFNQALELARPISHKLKIPLALNICQRTQNTHPQSSITAMDRECNMKNAFSVAQNFSAKHVLIIDDVMTTGNTVSELSFILKAAQVKQVDVCCAARTVKG